MTPWHGPPGMGPLVLGMLYLFVCNISLAWNLRYYTPWHDPWLDPQADEGITDQVELCSLLFAAKALYGMHEQLHDFTHKHGYPRTPYMQTTVHVKSKN